ncbi:hypothetical protein [Anaerosacchariphilus polymeriproducens]|uniref:Uncharacterized protein n=1 Tax=Anaerosacchariphilus polymeriproducens TaxID=1812858 RepID=A0A371AR20_9FIRM|nr:hypothetical protein [Anaerosacchariphilus polymeriproducens]RDU22019.1 hypothetical protein DWV06_15920 [Anaerosacchariphilus polymeriproducens]
MELGGNGIGLNLSDYQTIVNAINTDAGSLLESKEADVLSEVNMETLTAYVEAHKRLWSLLTKYQQHAAAVVKVMNQAATNLEKADVDSAFAVQSVETIK